MEIGGYILLGLLVFFIYLLPAIVAAQRNHHQFYAILLLNIFLGWTFLGWIISLVWSATAVNRKS